MTLGEFFKYLALCGYPQQGAGLAGGGVGGLKSVGIVAQSAVPASVTGVTTETTLATIQLPALGPNSVLRITHDYSMTNNANAKTITARINGTSFGGYSVAGVASSTMQRRLSNRNSTSSNLATPVSSNSSFSTGSSGFLVESINTSAPSILTLTGTLTNAADTITLESYIVELLNP